MFGLSVRFSETKRKKEKRHVSGLTQENSISTQFNTRNSKNVYANHDKKQDIKRKTKNDIHTDRRSV